MATQTESLSHSIETQTDGKWIDPEKNEQEIQKYRAELGNYMRERDELQRMYDRAIKGGEKDQLKLGDLQKQIGELELLTESAQTHMEQLNQDLENEKNKFNVYKEQQEAARARPEARAEVAVQTEMDEKGEEVKAMEAEPDPAGRPARDVRVDANPYVGLGVSTKGAYTGDVDDNGPTDLISHTILPQTVALPGASLPDETDRIVRTRHGTVFKANIPQIGGGLASLNNGPTGDIGISRISKPQIAAMQQRAPGRFQKSSCYLTYVGDDGYSKTTQWTQGDRLYFASRPLFNQHGPFVLHHQGQGGTTSTPITPTDYNCAAMGLPVVVAGKWVLHRQGNGVQATFAGAGAHAMAQSL
jgi:hypothetical protein